MIRFSTVLTRAATAVMLSGMLVLAGCHRGATKDDASAGAGKRQFDATIQAYKGGEFLVDGAVLTSIDAGSHFAYLKDQGRLPKTILLEPSDESKVRKAHLQYMARLELDYGFLVFYENKGTLTEINPVQIKARDLQDKVDTPATEAPEQAGKDASGSGGRGGQSQGGMGGM